LGIVKLLLTKSKGVPLIIITAYTLRDIAPLGRNVVYDGIVICEKRAQECSPSVARNLSISKLVTYYLEMENDHKSYVRVSAVGNKLLL